MNRLSNYDFRIDSWEVYDDPTTNSNSAHYVIAEDGSRQRYHAKGRISVDQNDWWLQINDDAAFAEANGDGDYTAQGLVDTWEDWFVASDQERKRAFVQQYMNGNVIMNEATQALKPTSIQYSVVSIPVTNTPISTADCWCITGICTSTSGGIYSSTIPTQENTMNQFSQTLEGRQQTYLTDRAGEAFYAKDRDLEKKYGLVDDDAPRSPKELLDRISSGKYILDEKYQNIRSYYPTEYFTWRDPNVKRDQEGYDAAHKLLGTLMTDTKDAIILGTNETALAKIKEIEAFAG